MTTGEISKALPYLPRNTKPPAPKCRHHSGLAVRMRPEKHQYQLVWGFPAEQGWVTISISITQPVREVCVFGLAILQRFL
jgi:hypothetical protein